MGDWNSVLVSVHFMFDSLSRYERHWNIINSLSDDAILRKDSIGGKAVMLEELLKLREHFGLNRLHFPNIHQHFDFVPISGQHYPLIGDLQGHPPRTLS